MIARVAGAGLGLLSFSITVFAGLWIDNPVSITLSRALWALLVFCTIGLILGSAAQASIDEQIRARGSLHLDDPSSGDRDPAARDGAGRAESAVEAVKG